MNMYENTFFSLKLVDEFINNGETSKAVHLLDEIEQKTRKLETDTFYDDWVDVTLDTIQIKRNIIQSI